MRLNPTSRERDLQPRIDLEARLDLSLPAARSSNLARILFLHEVGYFEKPIFEMHEFPEHLSTRGHEVAFLDFQEFRSSKGYSQFGSRQKGRVVPTAQLTHYSQSNRLDGIPRRLLAWATFPFFFRRALRDFNPDVVVCFSVPTSGWQALMMCRRMRIPFIFRALDVSHKIRKTVFAPLIKYVERRIYRSADWVSCNNPAMRDYCISLGAGEVTTSVNLPPLNLSHFTQQSGVDNDLLELLGIPEGSAVILYLGSFFYFSGLSAVISSLAHETSKPFLLLVGEGEQESELRAQSKGLGLEDQVKFAGYVPFQELPRYLALAHVAINPMVPSLVSHSALPNKALQYMASGLPVVSTKLRGLSLLFRDCPGLLLVPAPEDVLSGAISLLKARDREKLGQGNRQEIRELFFEGKAVDEFESLITKVVSQV